MSIVNGLTRTIRKGKLKQKPFAVLTIQCRHCGTRDDYKDSESLCHLCRHELDKKNLKTNPVSLGQTTEILSNEVKWECPNCTRTYDKPDRCCLTEWAYKENEFVGRNPLLAYQCSECLILYKRPVVCHSGAQMYQGHVLPNRNHDEFEKIKAEMTKRLGTHRAILGKVQ